MLDPNLLRNELDAVAVKLARRGFKLDLDLLRSQEERNPSARPKRVGKTLSRCVAK